MTMKRLDFGRTGEGIESGVGGREVERRKEVSRPILGLRGSPHVTGIRCTARHE